MDLNRMLKKVLFDANSAVIRRGSNHLTGIGRTTFELLQALSLKEALPINLKMYYNNIRSNTAELERLNLAKIVMPVPNASIFKNLVNHLSIKEIAAEYDILHVPHNYDIVKYPERTVITLHDAMFFSYPEKFLNHDFARKHYPKLAKKCKAIVTCSHSSKSDISTYMDIVPEKITVIPWGVSKERFYPMLKDNISGYLQELGISRSYFVMVSCDIGRKNTISLLKAYNLFLKYKPEHDLVLLWDNPPSEVLKEYSLQIENCRIHFLKGIDDNYLRAIYNGATASFFPSKYEGFGLPILESMACGTPVVTCKNSSLSEVGGEAALYTHSNDIDAMVDYMVSFEMMKIDLNKLSAMCLLHASKYDWSKVADDYIDFYNKMV